MAINTDTGKNYTLGRGKVLFDRFAQNIAITASTKGEGYRYVGNTPEFSTTGTSEDLEHFDSDSGVRVKDDSVQLSMDRSGSFTCDNIDRENLALMFQGLAQQLTVASIPSVTENIVVKRGRIYQLGETANNPSGHRNITITTVKKGASAIGAGSYQVDQALGQIYFAPNASDMTDGDTIEVVYAVAGTTRGQVISGSMAIYGQIKFIADNPKGVNRDYYFPYVKLSPDGDYNLKGEDWQSMGFTMEILKRGSLESVYVDERAVTV